MLKAKNTMDVTFEAAIKLMRNVPRGNLMIRFCFVDAVGKEKQRKTLRISTLYADWYGDCTLCPPNDTPVYKLHILLPNKTALDVTESVDFGTLMDEIEAATVGHTHPLSLYHKKNKKMKPTRRCS